jgi:hypothetical protein
MISHYPATHRLLQSHSTLQDKFTPRFGGKAGKKDIYWVSLFFIHQRAQCKTMNHRLTEIQETGEKNI